MRKKINQKIMSVDKGKNVREMDKTKSKGEVDRNKQGLKERPRKTGNRESCSRKRAVAWYNPPFNADVTTKVAKLFFEALDRNFPKGHRYNRI